MVQIPERALWRSVILVGLRATDADVWVGTADFQLVCALSGLEPDAVHDSWAAGLVAPACEVGRDRPARVATMGHGLRRKHAQSKCIKSVTNPVISLKTSHRPPKRLACK